MSLQDYIYSSQNNSNTSSKLIVLLPEIWGITPFVKEMAELIQNRTGDDVIILDFYQPLGLGPISLSYNEADTELARSHKNALTGEQFLSLWQGDFRAYIDASYPKVKTMAVVGFCFGGRLAWLTGADSQVDQIFSFYGAGAHDQYCFGLGSVEYLATTRGAQDLDCYAFYGDLDSSIPQVDRDKTREILSQLYSYQDYIFSAQHAFMNQYRANYDPVASKEATEILLDNLSR